MKDNETVKAGDMLMCISNEGYTSIGGMRMIIGLTEKSVNMSGSTTGWSSRDAFRWSNYVHYPCDTVPQEVIDFSEKTKAIVSNNAFLLKKQQEALKNRF